MTGQQTCPLYIEIMLTCLTASSDVSEKHHWQPLSFHLWDYCNPPSPWYACVQGRSHHRGNVPYPFSGSFVGSFKSPLIWSMKERRKRQGQRFNVIGQTTRWSELTQGLKSQLVWSDQFLKDPSWSRPLLVRPGCRGGFGIFLRMGCTTSRWRNWRKQILKANTKKKAFDWAITRELLRIVIK